MKSCLVLSSFFALVAASSLAAPGSPPAPAGGASRTYSIPHVLDQEGHVDAMPFTYDTDIIVVDSRGLPDDGNGRKAGDIDTLKLYLYGDDGQPMLSASGLEVCNPCSFNLDTEVARRHVISVEDRVLAKGGFPASPVPGPPPAVSGFAVVVVSGSDPDAISIQPMVEASAASAAARRPKDCCPGHVTLIK